MGPHTFQKYLPPKSDFLLRIKCCPEDECRRRATMTTILRWARSVSQKHSFGKKNSIIRWLLSFIPSGEMASDTRCLRGPIYSWQESIIDIFQPNAFPSNVPKHLQPSAHIFIFSGPLIIRFQCYSSPTDTYTFVNPLVRFNWREPTDQTTASEIILWEEVRSCWREYFKSSCKLYPK